MRVTDDMIRYQWNRGLPIPVIADQLSVPLRRVARIASGGQSAHHSRTLPPTPVGFRFKGTMHTAAEPGPDTDAYWKALTPPRTHPRREARMVQDDRSDESLSFDDLLEAHVAEIQQSGKWRGVA